MKICISGWYYRPRFIEAVKDSGYDAFIIKHRDGECLSIPNFLYPNRGLEFGAYRAYAEKHWDGESDVLFLHDDTEVSDLSVFSMIESLNNMGVDQAYIFHDSNEEAVNGGIHGRGIWMRGSTLRLIASDFPADMDNTGDTSGTIAQKGILMFHERTIDLTPNTGVAVTIPKIRFAHRGHLHDEAMFVYRRLAKKQVQYA